LRQNQAAIPANVAPLAIDLKGLQRLVPISRTTVYEEIKRGRLRLHKVGRRSLFLTSEVQGWLTGLAVNGADSSLSPRKRGRPRKTAATSATTPS
jgi:excisionase family DNA binding protein